MLPQWLRVGLDISGRISQQLDGPAAGRVSRLLGDNRSCSAPKQSMNEGFTGHRDKALSDYPVGTVVWREFANEKG